MIRALGRLPVRFDRNEGQTDPRVRFLSRGPGYGLFLASSEVVLSLDETAVPEPDRLARRARPREAPRETSVLRMRFVGARARPEAEGLEALPARSHYFVGSDPRRWRTDVPQYARVAYRGLWKGIDLTFYGTAQGQLEWDFTVSPGADPKTIRLAFEGARSLLVDGEGNLVVRTRAGEVVQRRPHIYQDVGGVRMVRNGSWVLRGKRRAGFRVDAYDPRAPLVIDPVLVYSTYVGGSRDESALAIAADGAGNVFVTGWTSSTDFPTAGPPLQGTYAGTTDVFVAKLSPTSGLVYSTYLGGAGTDFGAGIAVDAEGSAYLTGETTSTNFPTAGPPFQPASAGGHEAFVAKLGPTSSLVYSTYLGGSGYDIGYGIAVDDAGGAYVTGTTDSWDFPRVGLPLQAAPGGGFDAFVAALGPTSTLVYSTYLGGVGEDSGLGVAADAAGNAYLTGRTDSVDFPTAGPPLQASIGGSTDAFVAKLSPAAGLAYCTFLGG
ncbi:MAG TPA: SBBP repeat-containing protein, partial [Vicinamibacteria bacterium]